VALGWWSSILWLLPVLALIFFCLLTVLKQCFLKGEINKKENYMKNKARKMKNQSLLSTVLIVVYDFLISFGAGSLGGATPTIGRLRFIS